MAKRESRASQPKGSATRYWWLAVLVVAAALGGWLGWPGNAPRVVPGDPVLTSPSAAQAVTRRETRPTLDPARFVGKASAAHQVAREIPDVLDQLYCYCACDKHLGHKSLLSCYTDNHAAT